MLTQAERIAIITKGNVGEATSALAAEQRAGITGPLQWKPEREAPAAHAVEPDASDLFSQRANRIAEAQADHRARRRVAEAEVASRERLHARYRDAYGIDEADRLMASE